MVPVLDFDDVLHGLQFIDPDGAKIFLTGSTKRAHFYLIGELGDVAVICEGYATGATIREATEHAVVVAFDRGNLRPVAEALRKQHPGIRIIIAADNDRQTAGNPGIANAHNAAIAVGGFVAVPEFREVEDGTDFNDLARHRGAEAVRAAIEAVVTKETQDPLDGLAERADADPGAPFEPDVLGALAILRQGDPAEYQRVRDDLKKAGVSRRDLDREVRKQNLRVINGGANDSDGATERAGPYKVISNAICHEKKTPDGPVTMPLCNFNVRIVEEEIRDDGAERITNFSIEGLLQGGKPLPKAEVPAERYSSMNWVTTNWGTAPVIFAGQGARDHLRVAIQLLSGQVPRRTVFGHLGWRYLNGEWKYLHAGGAIGPVGPDIDIQVQTSDSRLSYYALPEPPAGEELSAAIRASLSILDLGPHTITYPLLCTVYRAPLGEVGPLDFTIFLAGPTGAQKTELTVLAQAHYGANFNGKNLPAIGRPRRTLLKNRPSW
jgi:hypothetical protein